MYEEQLNIVRKSVRKDGNRVGIALLLYVIISTVVSIAWMIGEIVVRGLPRIINLTDPAEEDRILEELMTEVINYSGTYLSVGVIVGLAFLFLFFIKSGVNKSLFRKNKKMTALQLIGIAGVFFGGQLAFQFAYYIVEVFLNLIGLTSQGQMEMATAGSQRISMFLYAGIFGPVAEEIVYRGFAMRCLEKHGKILAIVVSSILFGVMHSNLPQGVFAFLVGLVLAYVAMEYSIIWSIILHIFNNMILGDFMYILLKDCNEKVQILVNYGVLIAFFIVGLIVLIIKRKYIMEFVRGNMWERPKMRWIMTTVSMLIFVMAHVLFAISTLGKI